MTGEKMAVPELTNGEFEEFIKEGFVLVDFYADWCMPCVMMGPVIEEISEKFKGKIKVGKVNMDDNQELAEKFNIKSIPNFMLFKNNELVHNFVGSIGSEEFEEKLGEFVR